jgi:hypothetical protein
MKLCAYCGRENDDEAVHCLGCGTGDFKGQATAESRTPSSSPVAISPPTKTTSQLEFNTLTPEDEGKNLVTLLTCRTLLEADMITGRLESAGISAFIPDQFLMQTISWNLNTYGYVRVQVSPKDYREAKEFLLASEDDS